MIISTTLEALGIAALIAAYYHEDKFIKFESDCREYIARASVREYRLATCLR